MGDIPVGSVTAWRRTGRPVRDWAVHRRIFEPDLLAFLSEDGSAIEMVELLMGSPQVIKESSWTRAIIPVLAVLLVIAMSFVLLRPMAKKKIIKKEEKDGKETANEKDKSQDKDKGTDKAN